MSINVNTYSLVSLPDVKTLLGSTVPDDDNLIAELINRYSVLIETYLGRNVISRVYIEDYDGGGFDELFTNQYPITSISGIYNDTDWNWTADTLIDSDYYRKAQDGNSIIFTSDVTLGDYRENIRVVYTAGYSTVPEDIQMACIEEVARAFKNRQEIGVTSKSLGDGSISYSAQGLLTKTTMVLDSYRVPFAW